MDARGCLSEMRQTIGDAKCYRTTLPTAAGPSETLVAAETALLVECIVFRLVELVQLKMREQGSYRVPRSAKRAGNLGTIAQTHREREAR
jgi:hypothetical protein